MRIRTRFLIPFVLFAAALLMPRPQAQQAQRFIYAALPGVGGGNNMSYGGAGILVSTSITGTIRQARADADGAAAAAVRRTGGRWRRRNRSRGSPRTPRPRGCMSRPAAASPPTIS